MTTVGQLNVDLQLDTAGMIAALQQSQQRLAQLGGEASRQMQILRAEFNTATLRMDENTSATERLQAQNQYLSQRLEQQRSVVALLNETYQRSVAVNGENAEATQRLAVRLARAREEEARTEQQIRETNRQLQEQSDQTDETGRNWNELSERLSRAGERMSKFASIPIAAGFALATEGTKELRKELAILETNAQMAGVSVDNVNDLYKEMNSVIEDLGANTEGLSNLMAIGFDDSQMRTAMESIIGASIKFKETMKFEGIADGLQETLATGAAIGPFGELLERLGMNLDDFNEGLTEAIANGTEHQYVLDVLANHGLADVYEQYKKNNKALIEGEEAQYSFMESLARLGEELTPILTHITKATEMLLNVFLLLPGPVQTFLIALAGLLFISGPILLALSQITSLLGAGGIAGAMAWLTGTALPALGAAFTAVFGFILSPIGLALAAIAAVGAAAYLVIDNWEDVKWFFDTLWDGIKLGFSTLWDSMKAPFIGFVNFIIDGINVIVAGLNKLKVNVPSWVPGVGGKSWGVNIGSIPKLAEGGTITSPGTVLVGERGPELLSLPTGASVAPLDKSAGIDYNRLAAAVASALSGATFVTDLDSGRVELIVQGTLRRELRS